MRLGCEFLSSRALHIFSAKDDEDDPKRQVLTVEASRRCLLPTIVVGRWDEPGGPKPARRSWHDMLVVRDGRYLSPVCF